jgi:hypothetical protein
MFVCVYPGCNLRYSTPDAVRKHCRRHHQSWLNQRDRLHKALAFKGMSKTAWYCKVVKPDVKVADKSSSISGSIRAESTSALPLSDADETDPSAALSCDDAPRVPLPTDVELSSGLGLILTRHACETPVLSTPAQPLTFTRLSEEGENGVEAFMIYIDNALGVAASRVEVD